ncbi:SH3 domain-containing protein [Synechococcus sp. BSF8S]|uniref:SH3 domain-containing protein n=1 Tax=Synechococcales TaxID=1890424 RepID=UPI001629B9FC|nr:MULTISPECIES: SH3 domain-containing protein [unclassified Synechococcus]MBC1262268.1 SH3 domain-containing protein [Synechococcus sp. BSF8S]MBC1265197.1 SH3 domain-containing protein [Synechococcus sp. BSA11S]
MTWRWAWILGFALIAPAALPAGGGERRSPQLRRRQAGEPLVSGVTPDHDHALRTAPHHRAPSLIPLRAGEPLRLLRVWQEPGGEPWFHVETPGPAGSPRRGWLAG